MKYLFEYRYWLNCRNALLSGNFNKNQCDIYDEKISEVGSEIICKRYKIIKEIVPEFTGFFHEISDFNNKPDIFYDSSVDCVSYSKTDCKNVFFNTLLGNRKKDLNLGFTTIGPHRDNFKILLNSKESRKYCSQGQCRALSLSFKLAMSSVLISNCKEKIIFLVDDTVAELDSVKTSNFYPLIENKGQVFIAVPQGKSFFQKKFFPVSL